MPLRKLAADHDRIAGAAASIDPLRRDATYERLLGSEYASLTPENDMKWDTTQPAEGRFDFTKADALVSFARAHGMRVRGHTLVWGEQLPAWVREKPCDRATMIDVLRNHITTQVAYFAGRVQSWDVVSEAIDNDGEYVRNIWFRCIGPDYVDLAYMWADEADPAADLFYNDYRSESFEGAGRYHANGVYTMLAGLRSRGVPIDGMAMQAHLGTWAPSSEELRDTLARYRSLGLKTVFSELDVRLPTLGLGLVADSDLAKQKAVYRRIAGACRSDVACEGVTTWGFTDRYSWVPQQYPGYGAALPRDHFYREKPAYTGLREGFSGPGPLIHTFEAETATRQDNGELLSGAWRLNRNGSIAHVADYEYAGTYRFNIRAKGEQGLFTDPARMRVYLDGVLLGMRDVSSAEFRWYEFRGDVTAGTHELTITFINDAQDSLSDRNLVLDKTMAALR